MDRFSSSVSSVIRGAGSAFDSAVRVAAYGTGSAVVAGTATSLIAASTDNNIFEAAERGAYIGAIVGGGLTAAWESTLLARQALFTWPTQKLALASEVATLVGMGYACSPVVQHAITVLAR